IDKSDPVLLREELGDLLFQVVFHARIEKEEGRFDMGDVVNDITHKMIVRHPHVFADTVVSDSDEVIVNWDNIKKEEKKLDSPSDVLKRVPPYMPSLLRAEKVQGKALSKFGYGTATEDEAWEKVSCALAEGKATSDEKIGEALFAICALAQMRDLDLEALLSGRTDRFIESFEEL
ncbi:MAG: nucleotide pyrophosphohydrolase, partial [Clostridia bacterium]|nr:nucleotide pyrophosphohydrolase [Clostridia bacterium]